MTYWNQAQGHFIICTFYTFRLMVTETQVYHCTQLVNWVNPASEHPSPSVSPSSQPIMVWPVNWGLEPSRHSNITKANNGREWNKRDKMKGAYLRRELIRKSLDLELWMLTSITPQKKHICGMLWSLKNDIVLDSNVTWTKKSKICQICSMLFEIDNISSVLLSDFKNASE